MIYIILGIICLVIGYLLRNSVNGEFLDNNKFKKPLIIISALTLILSYNYADLQPLFGMFMYWWGNLL